jgi:hypothetical protein
MSNSNLNNSFFANNTKNGSISFRTQTIKLMDENFSKNTHKSFIQEEGREFGKDITNYSNLTNQENINPNLSKVGAGIPNQINYANKDKLQMNQNQQNLPKQSKSLKEDLTNKFKNYNLRVRNQNAKTVNEVVNPQGILGQGVRNQHSKNSSLTMMNQTKHVQQQLNTSQQQIIVNNEMMVDFEPDQAMSISNQSTQHTLILPDPRLQQPYNPNPQICEEYMSEIFQHLKEIEFQFLSNPHYMKSQTDINEKMRSILIDWLVEVHLKFKLLPETLFLTVNLVDRYLYLKPILRMKLQLVGVTAMLIACKYEEIYAPEVRDFVYITDKAYNKEEILKMENDMLATLEYNITTPSSFRFLEVYNYYIKLDETSMMFARYLLELFLIDYKMIKHNPSLIAAATVYITMKISKKTDFNRVSQLTLYTEEQLREVATDICLVIENAEKSSSLQAVKKKFSLPKYLEVAKIKFN